MIFFRKDGHFGKYEWVNQLFARKPHPVNNPATDLIDELMKSVSVMPTEKGYLWMGAVLPLSMRENLFASHSLLDPLSHWNPVYFDVHLFGFRWISPGLRAVMSEGVAISRPWEEEEWDDDDLKSRSSNHFFIQIIRYLLQISVGRKIFPPSISTKSY